MSDAEKFQLKLELTLNLRSAKDIQNWAIDKLDKNPADLLALDICFFSKDEEILDYCNNISNSFIFRLIIKVNKSCNISC